MADKRVKYTPYSEGFMEGKFYAQSQVVAVLRRLVAEARMHGGPAEAWLSRAQTEVVAVLRSAPVERSE